MKTAQRPATRIIGLGRGMKDVESQGEVRYALLPASQQRVAAIVAHYRRNEALIKAEKGLIVFSGGYAGTSRGQAQPPEGVSEAHLMADRLVEAGISARLIETAYEIPRFRDSEIPRFFRDRCWSRRPVHRYHPKFCGMCAPWFFRQ